MNLKKYLELRGTKQDEMKALIENADAETRALTPEEADAFTKIEEEIKAIDETIKAIKSARELDKETPATEEEKAPAEEEGRAVETREIEAFDAFLRDKVENRADVDITFTDNGAVVPSSIAQKIIEKVVEISPVFQMAERYNVKGTLSIPYYDEETNDITMAYADEFKDGESTGGKFGSISLTGFLGRAITDVSKSLINNSQFNIVDFVVNRMAVSIAKFIEGELINGTTGKIEGLTGVTQTVTTASATAVTADEIIDLQETIPDAYQSNAVFIMNKSTRTALRKLKDGQGNYLLNKDAEARWGYKLFDKEVYCSDAIAGIETGKTAILYGDLKGLAVKVSEDINIEVLRETKARQHVVEVLGFIELDSKVQNAQMLAKLVIK